VKEEDKEDYRLFFFRTCLKATFQINLIDYDETWVKTLDYRSRMCEL